ncbi:MAG: hypothetical protein KC646_03210 [Candidatus Cloacimonetes bacterium]|nr:hypothetical protein [Candidatus Cloacimonadota bacterium]
MIHKIYNLLLSLAWPLLILHFLRSKYIVKKYKKSLSCRLGWISLKTNLKNKRILVHAVSVGETVASQPFVVQLKKRFPDYSIIFSNVTETGHQRAQEIIPADDFVFFPLDYQDSVSRFLRKIKPTKVFIVETEIWPNFLTECQKNNIETIFINGRISQKSYERYGLFKSYFSTLIKESKFFMQSEIDLKRIISLGATKAINVGNLKYDQLQANLDSPIPNQLKQDFQHIDKKIIIFGSTHQVETQEALKLISEFRYRDYHFVIAPRHLNFLNQYIKMANAQNLSFNLKSKGLNPKADFTFLDTYGELSSIYCLSDIAIICGSFENIGGHSILEPAIFHNAILYGPHMQNNIEICQTFERSNAALRCSDFEDLKTKLELLFGNTMMQQELSKNAFSTVKSLTGATKQILSSL